MPLYIGYKPIYSRFFGKTNSQHNIYTFGLPTSSYKLQIILDPNTFKICGNDLNVIQTVKVMLF